MATSYRVLNGMKAAGVPKKFTDEEIAKRTKGLEKARIARAKKVRERRERLARHKKFVQDMASLGVFVPVQPFE